MVGPFRSWKPPQTDEEKRARAEKAKERKQKKKKSVKDEDDDLDSEEPRQNLGRIHLYCMHGSPFFLQEEGEERGLTELVLDALKQRRVHK